MADFDLRSRDSVVLLGAGASVEAGLPTANGLTELALDYEDGSEGRKDITKLYRLVAGAILFRASKNGRNPKRLAVNVEDVAEALTLLEQHKHWPLADVFGGVEPAISALAHDYESAIHSHGIATRISKVVQSTGNEQEKEVAHLAKAISDRGFVWPSFYHQAFAELRERCFAALAGPSKPCQYLVPLAKCVRVRCFATLNYDTVFEQACWLAGRDIDVGVFGWKRGHLAFRPNNVPFLKLHGSIDWCSTYDKGSLQGDGRPVGPESIIQGTPNHGPFASMRPTVVFGTQSKLTAAGPFLDLLNKFEQELEKVSTLAVIGYSFGDDHINVILSGWLAKSLTNTMAVASSAGFFQYEEDRDFFYQQWNPDQVTVTGLTCGNAIEQWCL